MTESMKPQVVKNFQHKTPKQFRATVHLKQNYTEMKLHVFCVCTSIKLQAAQHLPRIVVVLKGLLHNNIKVKTVLWCGGWDSNPRNLSQRILSPPLVLGGIVGRLFRPGSVPLHPHNEMHGSCLSFLPTTSQVNVVRRGKYYGFSCSRGIVWFVPWCILQVPRLALNRVW